MDAIKLLELYKASNFSSSSKVDVEGKARVDKAILEIKFLIDENNRHEQYESFIHRMAKMKLEVMRRKGLIKKGEINGKK